MPTSLPAGPKQPTPAENLLEDLANPNVTQPTQEDDLLAEVFDDLPLADLEEQSARWRLQSHSPAAGQTAQNRPSSPPVAFHPRQTLRFDPAVQTPETPPPPQAGQPPSTPMPLPDPPTPAASAPAPAPHTPGSLAASSFALAQLGASVEKEELKWQRDVHGDATKGKAFKAEILQAMDLRVFAFMRPKSAFITLVHSSATFFAMGAPTDLQKKDIAFVGDRTPYHNPQPVLLGERKAWEWLTKDIILDSNALVQYFTTQERSETLWLPPDRSTESPCTAPRMLLLPSSAVAFCSDAPRTPFQLHQWAKNRVNDSSLTISEEDYSLLLLWCNMAAQADPGDKSNSVLVLSLEAALSTHACFHRWTHHRLLCTLGEFSGGAAHMPPPPPSRLPDATLMALVAKQVGQSVAAALGSVPSHNAMVNPASQQSGSGEKGRFYDVYQVAALRGFCGVQDIRSLPPIWALFQNSKSTDSHSAELWKRMTKWARANFVPIDKGVRFSVQSVKEITDLKFTPGDGEALFRSAEKGISMLLCRPKTGEQVEIEKEREQALLDSASNRSYLEALKLQKSDPREPADDYHKLKLNLGTFCALLNTLFGARSDYTNKCMSIYKILDTDATMRLAHYFNPLLCRQITWAIIEDSRSFFAQTCHPDDFQVGAQLRFPISLLDDIASNVRYQQPIHRSTFPRQWQGRVAVHGGSGGGGPVRHPGGAGSNSTGTSTGGGLPNAPLAKNNNMHPILASCMKSHLENFGIPQLSRVLNAASIKLTDLPKLPAYIRDGTNTLCYRHILGGCQTNCPRQDGHAPPAHITDTFAQELCSMLAPGLELVQNAGGAGRARKRQRRA